MGDLADQQQEKQLTFGNVPPEKELIKQAGRTAQILLQDQGIKMSKPMR